MNLKDKRRNVFKAAQEYLREEIKLQDLTEHVEMFGMARSYGEDEIARQLLRLNRADRILVEACRSFVDAADKISEDDYGQEYEDTH